MVVVGPLSGRTGFISPVFLWLLVGFVCVCVWVFFLWLVFFNCLYGRGLLGSLVWIYVYYLFLVFGDFFVDPFCLCCFCELGLLVCLFCLLLVLV